MLFNSFDFILFLPLIIGLFYLTPQKYRWMLLLAASYYFYMCWRVEYIALIILSTLIDYWAGIKMSGQGEKKKRRKYLLASIGVNLGLLFFFKYYNFVDYNLQVLFSQFNIFYESKSFELLLPVGISFYTFQTLSYSFDVYKGNIKAEKHLGFFALYVSYFPQLVAGPIERADRLLPQLKKETKVTYEDFRYALNKILLGFFKKVVVADNLALYVDQMYMDTTRGSGAQLYLATFIFFIQIYSDFSGYSDIALGSARLMGVKLMENFKRPFWVQNLNEFWSKWHISLTSWIGDYIYRPLLEMKLIGRAFGSILVLVIIGLWHGANWTFVCFGLMNGVIIIIQGIYRQSKLPSLASTKIGMGILAVWNIALLTFTGVPFRCQNMTEAISIYKRIFNDFQFSIEGIFSLYKTELVTSIVVMLLLLATHWFNNELRFKNNWLYITVMLIIIFFLGQDLKNQFIYFQF